MIDVNNEKILRNFNNFASDRDWSQFHHIKNLSMALSVEVSELVEIFQWAEKEEIQSWIDEKNSEKMTRISDELADIYLYFLKIASLTGINLEQSITEKMEKNAKKYPIEKSKGNAKKYTELDS